METTIIDLENRYWQAMRENDVEGAVKLTKFPCLVTGPQGAMTVGEDEYRQLMKKSDGSRYAGIELENPQVNFVNDQTAIINYSVHVNGMEMLDVSTWVKEGEEWSCAFHSENPIQ